MSLLKLKPEQDGNEEAVWEPLSLAQSMVRGGVTFTLLSLVVFASWAYQGRWLYRHWGEGGAYAFWTILFFLGLIGLFGRLCWWKPGRLRFGFLLGLAFTAYAIVWCAVWFGIRWPYADYGGGFLGMAAFSAVVCWAFGRWTSWKRMTLVSALLSLAGYGLGAILFEWLRHSNPAKLLWGFTYGIGFGTAIGYVLYVVQNAASTLPVVESSQPAAPLK